VGGIAVFEDERENSTMGMVPLTPYQGFLFRNNSFMKPPLKEKLEKKISFALIEALEERYRHITICHHYNFFDVRPFYFHTFGRNAVYNLTARFTSVVDLTDMNRAWSRMEDNAHCEIHKGEKRGNTVEESDDFEVFDRIHRRTFKRQGIERSTPTQLLTHMYAKLKNEKRCQLFLARNLDGNPTSASLEIWDNKRAYHCLAASEPDHRNDGSASLILWTVFQRMSERLSEIDLLGCNSPKRGAFKAGFGGTLKNYFVTSLSP
jgi:lipid II:glycine glycyltransferase (peptidoglycan interpeptide bridge formation enzyme)